MHRRLWRATKDWGVTLVLAAAVFHGAGQLRAPELPEQAPDFELPVLDGEPVQLADLRGASVVLNFWAPWCGPCRAEVPQFNRFARTHPEVTVLGVATDGSESSLRTARKRLDIEYPVVLADQSTVSAYGVTTLPTTVIVDTEGRVVNAHTGMLTLPQLALMVP